MHAGEESGAFSGLGAQCMTPETALHKYYRDALNLFSLALEAQRAGNPAAYRLAAVQLRLLLCDTTRRHNRVEDISLAPRIMGSLSLPSLDGAPDSQRLPLKDWLAQEVELTPGQRLTVRELIRRVCDQDGGAHVDPHPHAGLPEGGCQAELIYRVGMVILVELNRHPEIVGHGPSFP